MNTNKGTLRILVAGFVIFAFSGGVARGGSDDGTGNASLSPADIQQLEQILLDYPYFEENADLRWIYPDGQSAIISDQLMLRASPETIGIIRTFLSTRGRSHRLKQNALILLGKIGSKPAIEAIRQFEVWSRKRFAEPQPFQFGLMDCPVDHYGQNNLQPLATTADEKGRTWALFQWKRHSCVAETWICRSLGDKSWTQPIFLDLNAIPEFQPYSKRKWDENCSFQIKDDTISIALDGQHIESRISDQLLDSDKDGIPDAVEARLLTNPKAADSDGDGVPDGKDSNPLTAKHAETNEVSEIRQAVFSALCATGNSQDAIVIVDKGDFARQEYYGYAGVVLRSPDVRIGFVNITGITVKLDSPDSATATIDDYKGNLAATGYEAKLKKLHGKWVVMEFEMKWIS